MGLLTKTLETLLGLFFFSNSKFPVLNSIVLQKNYVKMLKSNNVSLSKLTKLNKIINILSGLSGLYIKNVQSSCKGCKKEK